MKLLFFLFFRIDLKHTEHSIGYCEGALEKLQKKAKDAKTKKRLESNNKSIDKKHCDLDDSRQVLLIIFKFALL